MLAICIKELHYKITLGKIYEGEFHFDRFITSNDDGKVCWYNYKCFISLEDYRDKLLEKILE